jgi:phage terminase large subunit-like protein
MDKLEGIKRALAEEVSKTPTENPTHRLLDPSDRWTALILEPDEWQREEEYLFTSRSLRRKINPMLGIIVQHSFYEQEISQARLDSQKKVETITKLFNVYQSGMVKDWAVTADKVRHLQQPMRVTDCLYSEGWDTFVGVDCGGEGDLFAVTYLSVNRRNTALSMSQRFFADTEAWVTEAAFNKSPNRPLFERWSKQGWLNVCPGDVINPDMAVNTLMQKNEAGVNLVMFGFDPAQARQPINTLKAWLQSLGISTDAVKDMIVPVSQSYMAVNPLVGELEYMILGDDPWLRFSESPLWPWCFGNCQVSETREGLRKLLKSGTENKVDCIHALMDALYCFDLSEGKMQQ